KHALVAELAADFAVVAETGAKEGNYPPTPAEWAKEMSRDLDAGASWVVAEGRESGTVGLYRADHGIREDLVSAILGVIPQDKVIFEAPAKRSTSATWRRPVCWRWKRSGSGCVRTPSRQARRHDQRATARGATAQHDHPPVPGPVGAGSGRPAHPPAGRGPAVPPRDLPADRLPGAA